MNMFADRLKKIRQKNKISQRSLSTMLNISHTQVAKYEKGIDTPSGAILWKMTQVLKVSTEYLLGMINHVDLEGQYQYMTAKRSALFKAPEGTLEYAYCFAGEEQHSLFSYVFTVYSMPEENMPGWAMVENAPKLPAEFQPILYLEEKEGTFLQRMVESDNDFAFGALDGFLNDSLALGSCYFNESGDSKLELIIKRQGGGVASAESIGARKYVMISATRGYKPVEYAVDIIKGAFLDFYLPLTMKEKVSFLERV